MSTWSDEPQLEHEDDEAVESRSWYSWPSVPKDLGTVAIPWTAKSSPGLQWKIACLQATAKGGAVWAHLPVTSVECRNMGAADHTDPSHAWEEPDSGSFKLRGPGYLTDRVKQPSQLAPFVLVGIDLVQTPDETVTTFGGRPGGFVQHFRRAAGPDTPFVFLINFVLPWGNFVAYFCPRNGSPAAAGGPPSHAPFSGRNGGGPGNEPPPSRFDGLLQRFLEGDDGFRNRRLKIVPRCHEGPWVVKKAVCGKPAILGKRIHMEYHQGEGWFETVVDVCSSNAARQILACVKAHTTCVAVDLGFVIEGQWDEELPEVLLGALRFHRLDVQRSVDLRQWERRPA